MISMPENRQPYRKHLKRENEIVRRFRENPENPYYFYELCKNYPDLMLEYEARIKYCTNQLGI